MATEDPISLENDEGKEAEFSYFTSDVQDVQSKIQRKCYFRTSSSEKSLLCLHSEKGDEFMRYKPREITRIDEPEKKFLCVEYGPLKAPMYMLLDFRDSSESLDEWEKAISQMMGLKKVFRGRSNSESIKRRPSTNKTKRAVSTFQQINPVIQEATGNDLQQQTEDQATDPHQPTLPMENENDVEPMFSATTVDSHVSSIYQEDMRDRAGSDIDRVSSTGSEEFSSIDSLKSDIEHCASQKETKLKKLQEERDKAFIEAEVSVDELNALTLSDYDGSVYVSDVGASSPHTISIGDKILQVDSKNASTAQEAMNLIRSLKERHTQPEIPVRLERFPNGNVCVIEATTWPKLGIQIQGNKITSTQGVFRTSCDPAWVLFNGERSTRSISAINDHAVSMHATTKEVTQLITEALQEEMPIVFHVHPTEFLQELESSSSTNL